METTTTSGRRSEMDTVLQMVLLCVVTSAVSTSQIAQEHIHRTDRSESRDWGPWTGWSVCSETCGYGTAYRIRQCHTHHYRDRNSPQCQGQSKQYKLCILKNCSQATSDYRTTECAKHNNVFYGQRTYMWVPYINSVSPCELSCKSLGYGYYARFQKTVADFVICDEGNTAACIQGQCVNSGCDGILGSGSQPDRCGVCGGDGISCRLIRGIYTRTYLTHQGYNIITTIPAGARSINITEMSRSGNHLALLTSSGYFLNGDLRLQAEGSFKGAGTTFTYSRSSSLVCPGECLTAPGPLDTELRVELIYFSRNPGIYYHFTIPQEGTRNVINSITSPNESPQERSPTHQNNADHHTHKNTTRTDIIPRITHGKHPVYLPDTKTTNLPHQLHISSRVLSPKASPIYQPNQLVSNSNDDVYRAKDQHKTRAPEVPSHGSNAKPHQVIKENDVDNWLSELDDDSQPDVVSGPTKNHFHVAGQNGSVEYKHYYHTNVHDDIGDIPMAAPLDEDSKQTDGIRRNVAPSWLPSNSITSYAEFRSTDQQHPPVRSSSIHGDTTSSKSQKNDDSNLSKPSRISRNREYNGYDNRLVSHDPVSHLYSWRITGLTSCSEPCGGGLQETRVVCVKGDSQVEVIAENCIESIKPASTTIVCNNQPCEANWEISEWAACSVTCGHGLQKRTVICKQRISPTLTIAVSSTACQQPQPQARQFCQLDPCFTWRVSEWSKCSSECGFGQRTRITSCVNGTGQAVNDSLCTQLRPAVEEICDMGSCAQGWFHTKWSQQCSSKCGRGYYTRDVICSAADGTRLDEKKCGGKKNKPRGHKMCKATTPCGGQWFTGPWSQCSATCGLTASRHRDVLCVKHHGKMINQVVKEHNCVIEDKPPHTEPCGPFPACKPQWFVMSWSECSESCGTGVKTREVKCLDTSFVPSPDCDKDLKPSRRQPCNTQPCIDKQTELSEGPDTTTNEALQMDGSISSNEHLCKDSQTSQWCQLAKQARLCLYPHYRKICCHTCRKLDPKHQ